MDRLSGRYRSLVQLRWEIEGRSRARHSKVTLSRGESRGDWRGNVGGGRVCCVVDVGEVGLGATLLYLPLTALLYQLREKQRLEPWRHDVGLDGRSRYDCEVVENTNDCVSLLLSMVLLLFFVLVLGRKT